jgi:hypothetical protein
MNLNYETVTKIVGDLYITSQTTISQLQDQLRNSMLKNEALTKELAAKKETGSNDASTERPAG